MAAGLKYALGFRFIFLQHHSSSNVQKKEWISSTPQHFALDYACCFFFHLYYTILYYTIVYYTPFSVNDLCALLSLYSTSSSTWAFLPSRQFMMMSSTLLSCCDFHSQINCIRTTEQTVWLLQRCPWKTAKLPPFSSPTFHAISCRILQLPQDIWNR